MTIGHNSKAAITAEFEEAKPVKTRKVLQIVCEVPMENADAVLEALGGFPIPGQSRPVAIALLNPKEIDLKPQTAPEATRVKGGPRSKRAGILCHDPGFIQFLSDCHIGWECAGDSLGWDKKYGEIAAEAVRVICNVQSRAELDHDEGAAQSWDQLERNFYDSQQGRTPEALADQARAR